MSQDTNYIDAGLVNQAKRGNEKSLEELSQLATGRLRTYLLRVTLDSELTNEIVQESMLEMVKFLNNLNDSNKFWGWLRKIANNKLHQHNATAKKRKTTALNEGDVADNPNEGFANLVTEEFKQIVVESMQGLKPRHRQVLVLRCYEGLGYSQIAEEMDSSVFGAKMLFHRAKKNLAKRLARRGIGKGALIASLVLFGKMTAANEASAASISITATTLKAGAGAAVTATVASKTVLTTTAVVGIVAGTVAIDNSTDNAATDMGIDVVAVEQLKDATAAQNAGKIEQWFYFPEGPSGAVMMRRVANGKGVILQNEMANYRMSGSKVSIENYNYYNPDLSVMQLPTDSGNAALVSKGLLFIAGMNNGGMGDVQMRHYSTLDEDYFRCDWPSGAKTIDNRDAMHMRGWAYFKLSGKIGDEEIVGVGRIPFVYAQADENYAWMKIRFERQRFVDLKFDCFARPWQGLHTVDVIRRDAMKKGVKFTTQIDRSRGMAFVNLNIDTDKLTFKINMKRDLVENIEIVGEKTGIINFEYFYREENLGSQYRSPENDETDTSLWKVLTN